MMLQRKIILFFCLFLALACNSVHAWLSQGHTLMTRASVAALPQEMPAFFKSESATAAIIQADVEVDLLRDAGGPQLRAAEGCNHFFDAEPLWPQLPATAKELPKDRFDFIRLCNERKLKPEYVGFVYYAILETLQKLDVAFAQHRRWPNDQAIESRCLMYAGQLAHYSQDICQPLHVSIHYDGRAKADGSSPHSGIHTPMDDLPGRLSLGMEQLTKDQSIENFPDPAQAILDALTQSHALVDRVYELEKELPGKNADWSPTPAIAQLGIERSRAATRLTASLWFTAWKRSENTVKHLPAWRERMNFSPDTKPASDENP